MSWKNEISEYYESRVPKHKQIWNTKEEVVSYFERVVIPAFEEISEQLKPFVINVSIKKNFFTHTFKARITVYEEEIKSSFLEIAVMVESNSIKFSCGIKNVSVKNCSKDVECEKNIGKDFIISKFMKFFKSREEEVKEHKNLHYRIQNEEFAD